MGITLAVINHFKMSLRSQNGKPLSNICTGERTSEREREREGERKKRETVVVVYRYLGVVRTKVAVVQSKGKERDVCIGDVPTTTENIKGN